MSIEPSAPPQQQQPLIENFFIECPHCECMMCIEKVNCGIFRHGVEIQTGKQIDPHAPKEVCDELIKNGLIYGCGKPFEIKITKKPDDNVISIRIEICEYK